VTLLNPEDWRRGIAMVILWAYGYQLVIWPLWFNLATLLSSLTGLQIPAPVIIPWEQLMTGTATLGTVGGIQAWRERGPHEAPAA
jgi:hypothetical protein